MCGGKFWPSQNTPHPPTGFSPPDNTCRIRRCQILHEERKKRGAQVSKKSLLHTQRLGRSAEWQRTKWLIRPSVGSPKTDLQAPSTAPCAERHWEGTYANSREMQEGFEHTRALGRYVGQYLPHRLLPERPTSQEIDPQGTRGPNRAKWVHARALRSSVQLLKIACAHPLTSMIPVDYSG